MIVYFISGLGADKRAFQKIKLPRNFIIKHIDWIMPLKNESLANYSLRMAVQIDTTRPFVLIGLSFGGIVVTELSKILKVKKSIIISSIATGKQLPWYFKLIGKLRIHKIIPSKFLKWPNMLTFWAFGTHTKEEKELLKKILNDTNKQYLKWAIDALLLWTNKEKLKNIYHVHGTNDNILPIRYIQPDIKVQGGRHFMVLSMADTINKILQKELGKL